MDLYFLELLNWSDLESKATTGVVHRLPLPRGIEEMFKVATPNLLMLIHI